MLKSRIPGEKQHYHDSAKKSLAIRELQQAIPAKSPPTPMKNCKWCNLVNLKLLKYLCACKQTVLYYTNLYFSSKPSIIVLCFVWLCFKSKSVMHTLYAGWFGSLLRTLKCRLFKKSLREKLMGQKMCTVGPFHQKNLIENPSSLCIKHIKRYYLCHCAQQFSD